MAKNKKRILSGMRPSGKLHLGNLLGALSNWAALQDEYECFYMVADWHALTTDYKDTSEIKENIREMVADWLACGLDPEKSVLFVQSEVKEHAELHLLLSTLVPVAWLERCPTYKEQLQELKDKEINTYGFLGYPVLQAADILIYMASAVPVGEDQLPHLELTREIARRFNFLYKDILIEPQALLTRSPRVPGTDGRKMSKSYGNCIYLSDAPSEVKAKIDSMVTDPARIRANDSGHPDVCSVFAFHRMFSPRDVNGIENECRKGSIGCVACKEKLSRTLAKAMEPINARRSSFSAGRVDDIMAEGANRARAVAEKTMEKVRDAMKLWRTKG